MLFADVRCDAPALSLTDLSDKADVFLKANPDLAGYRIAYGGLSLADMTCPDWLQRFFGAVV